MHYIRTSLQIPSIMGSTKLQEVSEAGRGAPLMMLHLYILHDQNMTKTLIQGELRAQQIHTKQSTTLSVDKKAVARALGGTAVLSTCQAQVCTYCLYMKCFLQAIKAARSGKSGLLPVSE